MLNRSDIVTEARSWIGVRWRHQGRNTSGIDCVGLIVQVGAALSISDYDTVAYQRHPDTNKFLHYFTKAKCRRKPIKDVEIGDILALCDYNYPCHTAIYSNKYNRPHIIHAYVPHKSVTEEEYTDKWKEKTIACFEYRGII